MKGRLTYALALRRQGATLLLPARGAGVHGRRPHVLSPLDELGVGLVVARGVGLDGGLAVIMLIELVGGDGHCCCVLCFWLVIPVFVREGKKPIGEYQVGLVGG